MEARNIDSYILVIPDLLTHDLCAEIIKEYEDSDDWEDPFIDTGTSTGITDKSARNCQVLYMSYHETINKNPPNRKYLDRAIFNAASKAIEAYSNICPSLVVQRDSGYRLLKYKEGGFYREHTDNLPDESRSVSCSFF